MPKKGSKRGFGFSAAKGKQHQHRSTVPDGNNLRAAPRTRATRPVALSARAAGKRERAPSHAALGDVLSAAMEQSVLRKQQREAAAAARAARSAQRVSSPEPPSRTGAIEGSPTGGSGMSGTPQSPDRKKPRPSNQEEEENEEEAVQRQPIFEDSSDEEGAHKPPTPPPPTPPPKPPPLRGTVPVQYCLLQTKPFSRRFSYFTWLEPVFSSLQL